MLYEPTNWKDEVVEYPYRYEETVNSDGTIDHTPAHGEELQEGTPQSATNFNNIEKGISDNTVAAQIMVFRHTQEDYENKAEVKTVTLSMNSYPWPFNNKETTVALSQLRENTHYSVEVTVDEYSGGELGNIRVLDKAMNGFKLLHDGSATNVVCTVKIEGGMIA